MPRVHAPFPLSNTPALPDRHLEGIRPRRRRHARPDPATRKALAADPARSDRLTAGYRVRELQHRQASSLIRYPNLGRAAPNGDRAITQRYSPETSTRNGPSLGLVQLDGRGGESRESPGLLVLLFNTVA